MIPLTVILITAIIFAVLRAKLDSYLRHGKWKSWAFVLGVFVALCIVVGTLAAFHVKWWNGFVMGGIFAFTFWLFFDCVVGWMFSGNILYLGTQGFDLKMRQMFLYNKPIFGWKETGAIRQIFFKSWWLIILIGAYFSMYEVAAPMLVVAGGYAGKALNRSK